MAMVNNAYDLANVYEGVGSLIKRNETTAEIVHLFSNII